MSVPIESIVALGAFVGFVSGVFGVGGGFLTTPLLIFMGIPAPIAVGTQSCQLAAAGTSGMMGYWRRGNVDFLIGSVMLAGGIIGSIVGILLLVAGSGIGGAIGGILVVAGFVWLIGVTVVLQTLTGVMRAAFYLYAVERQVPEHFNEAQFRTAFG